jgi:virginiamycin B lyase
LELFLIRLWIPAAVIAILTAGAAAHAKMELRSFPVLAGAGAHDVYPAPDGTVWFTAQSAGKLGRLDPRTGRSDYIALGPGAAPHGVIMDTTRRLGDPRRAERDRPRGPPDPRCQAYPLPKERRDANLNIATFDHQGVVWFTGQNGVYGRLDPKSAAMTVFAAPRGIGSYGIATTPQGRVFFASLAGNYLRRIDLETGAATVWTRLWRGRAHGACGATAVAGCGSPAGTAAIFSAMAQMPRAALATFHGPHRLADYDPEGKPCDTMKLAA